MLNYLKSRMSNLQETVNNKDVEKYLGLFSECSHTNADATRTKERNERRKKSLIQTSSLKQGDEKFIKNPLQKRLVRCRDQIAVKGIKIYTNTRGHKKLTWIDSLLNTMHHSQRLNCVIAGFQTFCKVNASQRQLPRTK